MTSIQSLNDFIGTNMKIRIGNSVDNCFNELSNNKSNGEQDVSIQIGNSVSNSFQGFTHRPSKSNNPNFQDKCPFSAPIPPKPLQNMLPQKEDVTYLWQKDFQYGGVFITKPGKYVLKENIFCDYHVEKQLKEDGTINPIFTGNAGSARANIGISVCCDNVTIDGCGFSIQQSGRGAVQNRVFTAIECSGIDVRDATGKLLSKTCPVLKQGSKNDSVDQEGTQYYGNNNPMFGGGGPQEVNTNQEHDFFDADGVAEKQTYKDICARFGKNFADVGTENVVIKNLTMGRSSHFGIHGTNNRGLVIENCRFFEFEVAAIWLNNPINPTLRKLDIVGMDRFPQTLSQLWAFRTQGTGLKGLVNASYWGIIFNQQFGGVGQVFPQPTGGTLSQLDSGRSFSLQRPGDEVKDIFTDGGLNHQNVGARNAIVQDVNISQLQSQMITGMCLARIDDSNGAPVPLLFSNEADLEVGGGGHAGYTAKKKTCLLAINDHFAFYDNKWCTEYYTDLMEKGEATDYKGDTVSWDGLNEEVQTRITAWIDEWKGNDKPDNETCLRLADRALKWDGEFGKPQFTEFHAGLIQYRGYRMDDEDNTYVEETCSDKFVFTFSNVCHMEGDAHVIRHGPYLSKKAKCFSPNAIRGKAYYFDAGDTVLGNQVVRATAVMPVVNDMINNHSGADDSTPWWVSRNLGHQNMSNMPVDFGGHEMNGVVSIHCDRMWGSTWQNVNVVNAGNFKDPDYAENIANYGEHETFPLKLGFSSSVWGFMCNDSGGNIWRNCNTLNMVARTGANFACHNAFGSRGNLWENCSVLSCTGGEMWGFVADKGARGNIFRNCKVANLVGSSAVGAFVLRGSDNLLDSCEAFDITVVVDPDNTRVSGTNKKLALADYARVAAGVLCDFGGADQPEFPTRTNGYNTVRNCCVQGVTVRTPFHLDRNMYMLYKDAQKNVAEKKSKNNMHDLKAFLKGEDGSTYSFGGKQLKICLNTNAYHIAGILVMNQCGNRVQECDVRHIYNTIIPAEGYVAKKYKSSTEFMINGLEFPTPNDVTIEGDVEETYDSGDHSDRLYDGFK